MSILFHTEKALARVLWEIAPRLSEDGIGIRTDKGVKIQLLSGTAFELLVLRGQDDVTVYAPALVAYCTTGEQVENTSLTHRVLVEITLDWPVDPVDGSSVGLLDSFLRATRVLQETLYDLDLCRELSASDSPFTCIHAPGVWTVESGWGGSSSNARTRTCRWKRQLIVTQTDFDNPS